jgi:hypothetical protein
VKEELLVGNPFNKGPVEPVSAERKTALELTIKELGLEDDTRGSEAFRRAFAERGWLEKSKEGNKRFVSRLSESDSIALSQVAASARARSVKEPKFFTLDGGVATNAGMWGVKAITRKSNPPPKPPVGAPPEEGPRGGPRGGADLGSLVGGAHAIIKNGLEKIGASDAFDAALADYKEHKREMHKMLLQNPGKGVRIVWAVEYIPGINRDFPDEHKYVGMAYELYPGPDPRKNIVYSPSTERSRLLTSSRILPSLPEAAEGELGLKDVVLINNMEDWNKATAGVLPDMLIPMLQHTIPLDRMCREGSDVLFGMVFNPPAGGSKHLIMREALFRSLLARYGTSWPAGNRPPQPVPATREYRVQSGDTLMMIAQKYYQDAGQWPRIYNANRKVIGPNPGTIHPGQMLAIP